MKKIWFISHYAKPPEYATNIRHFKFAYYLNNSGYNVKIFAASSLHRRAENLINSKIRYKRDDKSGVEFIYVKTVTYFGNSYRRILNIIQFFYRLHIVIKELDIDQPDVIISSSPHPFDWLNGFILSKRFRCQHIAETRDVWPDVLVDMGVIKKNGLLDRALLSYIKFIYSKSNKLIFTMPGGIDFLKKLKIPIDKFFYINNGVDVEEFAEFSEKYKLVDEDLNKVNTFKVIYTGSIGKYNGIQKLVEAAEILQNKGYKEIQILIWGSGPERYKLEKYVQERVIKNLKFKGTVEKKYIPYILTKSNLNMLMGIDVAANSYGISPNKLFDYFASGKPILSNRIIEYDIIDDFNAGLSIGSGDSYLLAEKIVAFYEMKQEIYNEFCLNSKYAAEEFDFRNLTKKLIRVIEK